MRGGDPRARGAAAAALQQQQQTAAQQQRGYRNEKLHLLAKQKRLSSSDEPLMEKQAAPTGRNAVGRSLPSTPTARGGPRVVKLTSVLQQAPQHFDRVKVAAVERMLTDIDELPEQFKSAEIVYLSNNCLTHLQGVQQFARLRVLSAADNLLPDISCLEVLAACPNLQVASFERNPMTGLPNYRQKVLQLLPNLENLDGQVVTAQERMKVSHALQQEAACMAVMLSNACMVHKLARSAELLQLHTELRRTMFGTSSLARMTRGVLPSYIPLDLLKFLKLWDYEGSLSVEERRIICDALTREVVRVHKQLQHAAATLKGPAQLPALQAWDTAFAKVMLAQQRTIIQLVELVNVLHGEAASLVSKLTGQQPATPSDLQQAPQAAEEGCDRQLTADQALAQEREDLIIDLRDAALELAGLIAAGETASDAAQRCSVPLTDGTDACPSPRQLLEQQRALQQQRAAASPAAGRRSKQSPLQNQSKQGGPLSLRRRSSADDSLRLRRSPRPGSSPAQAGTARGGSMRLARSPSPGAAEPASGSRQPQQRQAGRYDGLLCSQSPSPSPEPSQLEHSGHSPAASCTSSLSSPARGGGSLSPTARRLLHAAQHQPAPQQQQQQHWELDAAWQQQQHEQQQWELDATWQQQQQEQQEQQEQQQQVDEETYTGSSGAPLADPMSDQWRALQEAGSAQHLLAVIENSPASSTAARTGPHASPPAAAASPQRSGFAAAAAAAVGSASSTAAAGAKPRPSLQSRGVGPMSKSPGMVSPASSPESPVREEIGVYRKSLEHWGSRIPTRPSSNNSWQGAQVPLPLQQQWQQAQADAAAGMQLAAQDSELGRSNPVQSPADMPQAPFAVGSPRSRSASSRGIAAAAQAAATAVSARLAASSAPASPSAAAAWRVVPGSPAVSEPASVGQSTAVASIGSLVGPCRGAVSRTLQLSEQQAAAAAAVEAAAAAAQNAWPPSHAAAGAASPGSASPTTLRKSVSWADRAMQEQLQQQQQPAATEGSPAAASGGQLFADDLVPGACSMYSPYPPGMRPHAAATQNAPPFEDAAAAAAVGASAAERAASVAASVAAAGPSRRRGAGAVKDSPVPSASPALSAAGEPPASDAVGMLELSELSGLSNPSPSSVQFGGGASTPPERMNFNALYSVYGEPRSEHSDELQSGQCSTTMSGLSVEEGGPYETRDMSRPPQGASASNRAPSGAGGHATGSPGAHVEISFALQEGSPGSSLGEPAAWLAGQRVPRGVAGLLGQLQAQQQQQQQAQPQAMQPPPAGQPQQQPLQQQDRQLLWDLLHSDEDNMQLDSPSSGPDSSAEGRSGRAAAVGAGRHQQQQQQHGCGPVDLPEGSSTSAAAAKQARTGPSARVPPLPLQEGLAGAAAAEAQAAAGPPGRPEASAGGGAGVRGAAGATLCDSSRASFSSSMDLSPVKKQLFRSVSHSCHSLLQNAAGLSSIAAQLDAAAGVAAGHGSKEAVQAGREALMAKQQRAELHQRVQQQPQGGLSQQLAAGPQQRQAGGQASGAPVTLHGQRVSVAARKVLSSSAETASSWAASSITPYINEAKAEAEAALAAADAAAQLSTSCPAALMMQAHRLRDSQSLPATTTASASSAGQAAAAAVAAAVVKEASAAVVAAAQKPGVLLGLSPVVPGALDRASLAAAQPAAARSAAASEPSTSPRPELAHGAEAVAKALFPAAGTGAAAAAGPQPAGRAPPLGGLRHHHTESVGSATPAVAGAPGHLTLQDWPRPQGHAQQPAAAATGAASAPASPAGVHAGAKAAAQSLPASPVPARADVLRVSAGAASLPASPAPVAPAVAAAAAAAAANVLLPSSRGSLGPRSTAALAELQTQLLTMAVEKGALQRQLQKGHSQIEQLQEKACKGEQLEQVVQQMRSDLQQATHMLEHTGGAVHEQAALNQQLQEQMQQLQQQLWTTEAERRRQAAAGTLAKISLCRRVLRHYAAAAAAVGEWRRLKQASQQRGRVAVQRHIIRTWRSAAQLSKAVAALQCQHSRRRMAAAMGAWMQAVLDERVAVVQEAAAASHWARSTGRRALALWRFYTQQARMLGVDLPSSGASSVLNSPRDLQLPVSTSASPPARLAGLASTGGGAGASRAAARSLSFGVAGRQQLNSETGWQLQRQDSGSEQSPERQPGRFATSAKKLLSAGLVTLTERLSGALSPTKAGSRQESSAGAWGPDSPTAGAGAAATAAAAGEGPYQWPLHAGRRNTVMGFEQQQQPHVSGSLLQKTNALASPVRLGAWAVSVAGADRSAGGAAAGTSAGGGLQPVAEQPGTHWRAGGMRKSGAGALHRSSAAAAAASEGGALNVPLALQASFVQASRSQRLRRRWLLVKAFSRWSLLLQLLADEHRRMAAAGRHAARRLQRRAWGAWKQHTLQQQRLLPNGLSHEAHHMLQQHVKSRQQLLLLRVVSAWRASCREAADSRRTAALLAQQQRRRMQRLVLTALADNAVQQYSKRCRQQKADRHRTDALQQRAWFAWKDSIGVSHAAAAWQAQRSQQLLARVVCRWQQLSAAVTAAAAAGAKESRLAHLQRRRELGTLRAAFTIWRTTALETVAETAMQTADAAREQLQHLQSQHAHDQQQLQQLPGLLEQQSDLQQQLAAAAADKVELEQVVQRQQQQLQQAAAQHQQQMAALQSQHEMGVTVLQEQLQQACTSADETMQQLQRLQEQHQQLLMEQQSRQHDLEQQVAVQKQELEQQARQQLHRLDQQQLQWNQQQRQDARLVEQLAHRKAQCQELALQLKRCTEKLNTQTAAVQSVKAELTEAQSQLAAARALSRNKSLTLTEKAVAAERGRSQLEQRLAQQELANRELQLQLADVQRQLDQQRAHGEARRVAAMAEQRADMLRLQEHLVQKDDIIAQLKDSMGAVQVQLASQQAKVVSETNQLRINWTQAKQIIKQQRKTIKAQELQLQLLGTPASWPELAQPTQPLPQQQQPALGAAAAGVRPAVVAETSDAVLKYPITSAVLQSQQQQAAQHSAGAGGGQLGAGPAQGSAPGAEAPQSVLTRTSELLQCTDEILKSLRARTAQHC